MSPPPDDTLISRLPLPLAQLYRRAHNAKTPRDAHDCAVYLWEAALKLLASAAIVTLQADGEPPAEIAEKLKNLVRPSLGHWRELIRLLIPALAGRVAFAALAKLLDERRVDLPRAAALNALLRETHKVDGGQRQSIVIAELIDRLIRQRNDYVGHGASAVLPADKFRPIADALLAAAAELFPQLDVLAGRQLIAVTEIRSVGATWLVERSELRGVAPWRIASLELLRKEGAAPALVEGLYLVDPARPDDAAAFLALRPLLDFDAEHETVRFLNGRRGKNVEMLCYTTGERAILAPGESPGGFLLNSDVSIEDAPPGDSPGARCKMIGDYELISELGRGAMGVVYRAKQVALGREVALKVQPRPNDPKADARFRREVRALARVDHPNLVKVFTSGVEGEQFYYTMELLDGAPLTAISDALTCGDSSTIIDLPAWQSALSAACDDVRRGEKPMSDTPGFQHREQGNEVTLTRAAGSDSRSATRDYIRQIVSLMRQCAHAAHALHEHGVLHRDIKPGNIQVTPDGSQAVLLDLGLAQLADDVEGRLTRTTQFVGTRRYASPEQQIDARSIDRRADVYSLGATLWELISLRPLFDATDETPLPELIARVQRDEPTRLRSICPAISRDLEAVVHKCLEKERGRRYATAGELAADLQRVLDSEPVTARAVGTLDRAWKWVKRRPAIAALCGSIVALIIVALGSVFWQLQQQLARQKEREATDRQARAAEKVNALAHANIADVPFIVNDLKDLRDVVDPLLQQKHTDSSRGSPARLAYALALLPNDPAVADELLAFVPTAKANEILVVREALKGHPDKVEAIWPKFVELHAPNRILAPGVVYEPAELPLAAMLCGFLPADERWTPYVVKLAGHLVSLNPLEAAEWQSAFVPLRKRLTPELRKTYIAAQARLKSGEMTDVQDTVSTASRFDLSADLLARFAFDDPATLAELLQIADARHYRAFLQLTMPNAPAGSLAVQVVQQSVVMAVMRATVNQKPPPNASEADIEALAVRQANAATTLLHLGEPQHAWKMLVHAPDPTARSYLIHGLIPRGVDFIALIRRYNEESNISAKRAILLALGEYTPSIVWRGEHRALIQQLLREFRDHPDPGLHGAIDWLLRQRWGKAAELDKIVTELAQASRERQRPESRIGAPVNNSVADAPGSKSEGWFVNSEGQTFTAIRGPVEFMMGSPPDEPGRERGEYETQYRKVIPRSFAIDMREVTVAQFLRFNAQFKYYEQFAPEADGPIGNVSWYEAAAYCRWLSEQEGVPENQMCYPPVSEIKVGMALPADFLSRTGYRLPTDAEWEYACRAGAVTARAYGRGVELLGDYARFGETSRDHMWPCGSLKPNDLGLFDMNGNAMEWSQDAMINHERHTDDTNQVLTLSNDDFRILRGGAFTDMNRYCRAAQRSRGRPAGKNPFVGFRPARTIP